MIQVRLFTVWGRISPPRPIRRANSVGSQPDLKRGAPEFRLTEAEFTAVAVEDVLDHSQTDALTRVQSPRLVAQRRGRKVSDILGRREDTASAAGVE